MFSDFPGLILLDSEIINEILERTIDPQTTIDDIFSNDNLQTNNDNIFSAVMECADQFINVVKETIKKKKKMARMHSINRGSWQIRGRELINQAIAEE